MKFVVDNSPIYRFAQISKDLPRANAGLAVMMADALDAIELEKLTPEVTRKLESILGTGEAAESGVPVSIAAKLLNVSERTVRTWINKGVLKKLGRSTPLLIKTRSLAEALHSVRLIRNAAGEDTRLLRWWSERQNFDELASRLTKMDMRVTLDLENLDEELFT
jgi:hypothetical protein